MAPMSEISPASRRSLGTRQRRLRRTTLPPAPHHKRNSRPGHVWSLTAAERKLAQQDLVIAVRDEPRQCRRGIKTVASIETKSVRVERRGADPEIARSELQRLLLKPSEDARADALTLGSRQESEKLKIRAFEPRGADGHCAGLLAFDLDKIARGPVIRRRKKPRHGIGGIVHHRPGRHRHNRGCKPLAERRRERREARAAELNRDGRKLTGHQERRRVWQRERCARCRRAY